MSKQTDIEEWLLSGNSITQREAIEKYNSYRLSAVIYKFKKKFGQDMIETEMIEDIENNSIFARYKVPEDKLKKVKNGLFGITIQ